MADEQQVADPTEANGSDTEPDIKSLLADWDNKASKSLAAPPEDPEFIPRDPDEIAEFESRISELETEKGELGTDIVSLTERAEASENALEFVDENLLRIDQHDFDRTVEKITSDLGIDKRVVELEFKQRLLADPDFVAVADARFDAPEKFETAMENFVEELSEQYPRRESKSVRTARHFAHAVRIARNTHNTPGGVYNEGNYGDFSKMNDREFAQSSREVFADMKSGKLRPEGKGRGGCLSTSVL